MRRPQQERSPVRNHAAANAPAFTAATQARAHRAQNGESAQIANNRSTVAVSYFIATGDTTGATESTGTMTLVRENGGWRIDHVTGVAVFYF